VAKYPAARQKATQNDGQNGERRAVDSLEIDRLLGDVIWTKVGTVNLA
jgi:hypothetical protein